jgi:hypothetical protein
MNPVANSGVLAASSRNLAVASMRCQFYLSDYFLLIDDVVDIYCLLSRYPTSPRREPLEDVTSQCAHEGALDRKGSCE